MQITLNQSEIEKGIVAYISNAGIDTQHKEVTIKLTAGRKPNGGYTATVDITPLGTSSIGKAKIKAEKVSPIESIVEEPKESVEDDEDEALFG